MSDDPTTPDDAAERVDDPAAEEAASVGDAPAAAGDNATAAVDAEADAADAADATDATDAADAADATGTGEATAAVDGIDTDAATLPGLEAMVDPDAIPTNPNLLEEAAAAPPTGGAAAGAARLPMLAGWAAAGLGLIGMLVVYLAAASPAQNRVTELEDQLTSQSANLEKLEGTRDELEVTVEELEGRIAKLDAQNAELSTEAAIAEQALQAMRATQSELEEKLQKQIKVGSVLVKERDGELVVDLIDKIVFDSGMAELNDSGKDVLKQVGETLKKVPDKMIVIAGHTDNLKISDKLVEQFPTNWELSTARATHVVRFLEEEVKIPGKRLAAMGHAEYRPVARNKSKAGRRKNRRIEVRLLPLTRQR